MSISSTPPIEWSVFLKFIDTLSIHIDQAKGLQKKKYAVMQTAIASGAYFGLSIVDILESRWHEIHDVACYKFLFEWYRKPVPMNDGLKKLIGKNYQLVKPLNDRSYILKDDKQVLFHSMIHEQFNEVFKDLLALCNIQVDNACAQTLRCTYALKIWEENNRSAQSLEALARELRMDWDKINPFLTEATYAYKTGQ